MNFEHVIINMNSSAVRKYAIRTFWNIRLSISWLFVFRGQSLLLSRTDLQMEHLQMWLNFWVTVQPQIYIRRKFCKVHQEKNDFIFFILSINLEIWGRWRHFGFKFLVNYSKEDSFWWHKDRGNVSRATPNWRQKAYEIQIYPGLYSFHKWDSIKIKKMEHC